MATERDLEIISCLSENRNVDAAFRMLVEDYGGRLYKHIRKMLIVHQDTDDVLQLTFIKAFQNISSFRQDSQLYTWLYRIATNETLNYLKKRKRNYIFSVFSYEDYLVESLHDDPYFDGKEAEIKIQKAILSLPEKQRLVFNLRYYDEMKYEDMSKILNTSEGALKASYHHAVKKVEKFLNLE